MTTRRPFPLLCRPSTRQWILLSGLSLLFALLFLLLRLPAALLMGPMAAAILLSTRGVSLKTPPVLHIASQAIIGTMIGRSITPSILVTLRSDWALSLLVVLSTVGMASFLGGLLGRLRVLPGTSALWGLSPGAATVMMVMAEAYGADARLVAFMQYLRVAVVVTVASFMVRFWIPSPSPLPGGETWFPPVPLPAVAGALTVAVAGAWGGRMLKIPAGSMLSPMILAALLHAGLAVPLEIPPWILAVSYALLGWGIGLGFTREIVLHALRALPKTLAAILALILFSGGIALILVRALSIDPLTAYLATSPGGMDSVAIIANSAPHVDLAFVMTLQTLRFVMVLLVGPPLSRFLADRFGPPERPSGEILPEGDSLLKRVREDEDELD